MIMCEEEWPFWGMDFVCRMILFFWWTFNQNDDVGSFSIWNLKVWQKRRFFFLFKFFSFFIWNLKSNFWIRLNKIQSTIYIKKYKLKKVERYFTALQSPFGGFYSIIFATAAVSINSRHANICVVKTLHYINFRGSHETRLNWDEINWNAAEFLWLMTIYCLHSAYNSLLLSTLQK